MLKHTLVSILTTGALLITPTAFADTPATKDQSAKKSTEKQWPEGVTPSDVYRVVRRLNQDIDLLVKKKEISKIQAIPKLKETMSPMMVFQLHIATIEMLHDYELNLGLRPVPIVTSSPIEYFPADVKYLSDMIMTQMQKILKHFGIEHDHQVPSKKDHTTNDVFTSLLQFYLKLAALNGLPELTSNQAFSQMYRINMELKDIVLNKAQKINDVRKKRLLAASTYGASPYGGKPLAKVKGKKTANDTFKSCLEIRRLMKPLLDKYKIKQAPIPNYDKAGPFNSLDVFIQTQIIIAEMGAWKRAIKNRDSTPITAQFRHRTPTDVYQEAQSIIYMLDRLKMVSSADSPRR